MTAAASLAVALVLMLAELRVSTRNERWLRRQGAVAAPDPTFPLMRAAYPGTFVLMGVEGWLRGPAHARIALAGAVVFLAAKLLKAWAIRSLGRRWTYRVYVLPGAPLVTAGPYRWVRHPNYVGVIGELAGFALLVGAWVSGAGSLLVFGELLRRRVRAEERALGLSR